MSQKKKIVNLTSEDNHSGVEESEEEEFEDDSEEEKVDSEEKVEEEEEEEGDNEEVEAVSVCAISVSLKCLHKSLATVLYQPLVCLCACVLAPHSQDLRQIFYTARVAVLVHVAPILRWISRASISAL